MARRVENVMVRVLVTGVTGFIGYNLSQELTRLGYDVWGLVRFTSNRRRTPDGVRVYVADLTDPYAVAKAVRDIRPQAVFHLGALTPVSESFKQPRLYMEMNYFGTVNLAEACLRYCENLKLFAYASTSEVYGNQEKLPITERHEPKPNTPYSVSKYAAELYLRYYMHEAYDFPVVVVRPFNTYGRAFVNQPHFVVEKVITEMLKGAEKLYLGSPEVVRDFMFRDDHVNSYISVLNAVENGKDIYGEVFNFCTGNGVSIAKLVETARRILRWEGEVVWHTHVRPADIRKLIGDYEKAKTSLGWRPRYTLEEGLKRAADEWREALGL